MNDPFGRPTVPCRLCSTPTASTATQLCDRCWELERRIHMDRALALQILGLEKPLVTICDNEDGYPLVLVNGKIISTPDSSSAEMAEGLSEVLDCPIEYLELPTEVWENERSWDAVETWYAEQKKETA